MKGGRKRRRNPTSRKPFPKVRAHFGFRDSVSRIGDVFHKTQNMRAAFKELTLCANELGPRFESAEKRFNRNWRVVLLEDAVTELKVSGMSEEDLTRFKAASASFLKIQNRPPSPF